MFDHHMIKLPVFKNNETQLAAILQIIDIHYF